MSRTESSLARLKALLPPPAPTHGWGQVRLHAEAFQFAHDVEEQVRRAKAQLRLGATLIRTDGADPRWDVTQALAWRFSARLEDEGAGGPTLDVWGRALAVPRFPHESDPRYARRILAELIRPSTTNLGMAQVLDDSLEIRGTQVLDSASALKLDRFDTGKRFNAGLRFWGFDRMDVSMEATFVVFLPLADYGAYAKRDIEAILDRRKAAGTRLLRLVTAGLSPNDPPPMDFTLPRPSRFNGPKTRFNQPRAFEPIQADLIAPFGRFNWPIHFHQGRRFAAEPAPHGGYGESGYGLSYGA